jgi:hypothetical protein
MIFPYSCTLQEKKELAQLAEANGFNNMSAFIRNAIVKHKVNTELIDELKAIKALIAIKVDPLVAKEVGSEFVIRQIKNFYNINLPDNKIMELHSEAYAIGMSAFDFCLQL